VSDWFQTKDAIVTKGCVGDVDAQPRWQRKAHSRGAPLFPDGPQRPTEAGGPPIKKPARRRGLAADSGIGCRI